MMTLIAVFALVSAVAQTVEVKTSFKTSYMNWVEHLPDGSSNPVVEEFGPIFSAVADATFEPMKNLFGQLQAESFGGLIYYKGSYLSDGSPLNTYTVRFGATIEATTGYKIAIGKDSYFSPLVTLGFSTWARPMSEIWLFTYNKLGASLDARNFFIKAGFLIPLFTQDNCFQWGMPWANQSILTYFALYPKGIPTPFIEAGARFTGFKINVSYEPKGWEKSDFATSRTGRVYQPKTTENLIGLSIDWPQR